MPAFLVHMKPLLKIDGEVVAEGSSSMLGSSQVLYSSFLGPEEETWFTNGRGLTVGADYNISLNIQKMSLELIKKRIDSLEDIVENHPSGEPATQEMIDEALYLTGLSYFAKVDVLSDLSAKDLGIVWTRQPSQAIVAQDLVVTYFFWWPWRVSRGTLSIDVKRDIVNPISVTGKHEDEVSWMLTIGAIGSATEHAVFEKLYDVESVSTEKILALANRQGIPIYTIDSTNVDTVLPKLNTFSIVKDNIRQAVEKGWTALCPQRNITLNSWNGQGWIIVDPASGSAGYLLAGHLVSGNTVEIINGGSSTEPKGLEDIPWVDLLHAFHTWLHDLGMLGIGIAFLAALIGGWVYIKAGGAVLIIFGGGALLFVGLLAIAVVLWYIWIRNEPILSNTRRRKYMYGGVAFA